MLTPLLIPSESYSLASIKSLTTINWVRGERMREQPSRLHRNRSPLPHQAIWRGEEVNPIRTLSCPYGNKQIPPFTGFIRLQSINQCYWKKNAFDYLHTWDKLAEEIVSWERILKQRVSSPPWSGSKWTMMNSNAYFLQFWHTWSQYTSAIF